MKYYRWILASMTLAVLLGGCAADPAASAADPAASFAPPTRSAVDAVSAAATDSQPSPTATAMTATPEASPAPSGTPAPAEALPTDTPAGPPATPTPDTRPLPKYWPEWPLVPTVSARAKEIYQLGQQLGNDPRSFTTIGDCQSEPNVFMGTYDTSTYQLPEGYENLEETVRQFKGSFQRDSITVKDGLSVASVLSPAWADPELCQKGESPLACEFRLHKPVIVFINLGTNWKGGDDVKHEEYMRQVVEIAIEHGVLPILSTKGDNLEGDHRINQSIARVAYDYQIPLWNFWLSIRDLPGKGIDGTREGGYLIPDAWPRRSFTGLQALDAVWRGLNAP